MNLGGLDLSNVQFDLTDQGFSIAGEWTNALFAAGFQNGTIESGGSIHFETEKVGGSLGGFALQNLYADVDLESASTSVTLYAGASLPLLSALENPAQLTGIYSSGHYSLSVTVPSITLGALSLTGSTFTLDDNGLAFSGTANLPSWLGSTNGIVFSGEIPDADHYTFNGSCRAAWTSKVFCLRADGRRRHAPRSATHANASRDRNLGPTQRVSAWDGRSKRDHFRRLGLHSHQTTGKRDAGRLHARARYGDARSDGAAQFPARRTCRCLAT